jgi:molybdate transport system regulatory protein
VKFRVWLEKDGKKLIGKGRVEMLRLIIETKSLKKTAERMGMSYRHAWGHMREMGKLAGGKVIESRRGGKGGAWTVVTPLGMEILMEYEKRYEKVKKNVDKYFKSNPVRINRIINKRHR